MVKTFGDFKDKNKDLDSCISSIKDNLSAIKATTDLLYQTHLSTVQNHSPLSLTPKGKEYSGELDIEKKVFSNWDSIRAEIEKSNPNTPYDVQTVCLDLAIDFFQSIFSQEERNEFKQFAYEKGVNLLEIYPIIGIVSRDKYLGEKGKAIEEIDKHDPSKK